LTDTSVRSQRAHRASVEVATSDMAQYLREVLGPKLTAYIADVADQKAVGRWASGTRKPQPRAEERLRSAYAVFHLLQSAESPHTVRAWMVGLNPQLDDESPATVLREGRFKDVLAAARAFLAGG